MPASSNKALQFAKTAGNLLRGGGKTKLEEAVEDDTEKTAKVTAGLVAIGKAEQAYLKEGEISKENARDVARQVKGEHSVFKSLEVVDGDETWDYEYSASPGKRGKKTRKRRGQLQLTRVRAKDVRTTKKPSAMEKPSTTEKLSATEKLDKARVTSGAAWEEAVLNAIVKEVLVPQWTIVVQVPVEIVVRGQKQFHYPSKENLARLKIQRGHRRPELGTRYPEVTMEVKEPGGQGALREVYVAEVTLVEDFTAEGDFARHKIDQFTGTLEVFKEKYGTKVPIHFHFLAPREPTDATEDFIVGTIQSQGMTNVKVNWMVVETK